MSSVNKVILIGRLGKDVDVIGNNKGARFTLATSESWKDKNSGEKQERTEWTTITCWGKIGELCAKYLSKGSVVYVEGKLKTDKYAKDGVEKYSTGVEAFAVQFLSPKNEQETPKPDQSMSGTDIPW